MTHWASIGEFDVRFCSPLDAVYLGRRAEMVEQRFCASESVNAHQLLVIERPAGLAELRVPFVREAAKPMVVAHTRLPRRACSRSIASNSDLKFPSPNPREPCRSITSKNTVGRSSIGCVKICRR